MTGWDGKFGLQHLSQCGSTYNYLCRSVPEIHSHAAGTLSNQPTNKPWDTLACCWDVKQPTNKPWDTLACCWDVKQPANQQNQEHREDFLSWPRITVKNLLFTKFCLLTLECRMKRGMNINIWRIIKRDAYQHLENYQEGCISTSGENYQEMHKHLENYQEACISTSGELSRGMHINIWRIIKISYVRAKSWLVIILSFAALMLLATHTQAHTRTHTHTHTHTHVCKK